jgi:uncharacterized Zn finger protein (UPF0148 family)
MKIMDFDCPSCGASLHVEKGKKTLSCPYCDSTVIVPEALLENDKAGWTQEQPTVRPTVIVDTSSVQRSCSGVIVSVVIFIIGLTAALVFWLMRSEEVKEALSGPVSSLTGGSSIPLVMSFGGEGMSAGFFQDAEHVCVDPQGNIYVAEFNSGRIQVFDPYGTWTGQWEVGKAEDIYIYGMDISRDGRLYIVYDSELYIHDAQTGELLGQLRHPDGWGFEDVAVCDDGSVVASWYCNRDDILKFAPDGSLEFVLREAISGQSGDSELDTEIAVDGAGNIFAYGSFNGSIFKFSPNGRFLNRFGSDGDREGQFTSPSCICTDPMGRVWVSDFGDLLVFDNDGTYIATLDPGETLYDIYITGGYQLFGITYEEIVVQLDLSEEVDEF